MPVPTPRAVRLFTGRSGLTSLRVTVPAGNHRPRKTASARDFAQSDDLLHRFGDAGDVDAGKVFKVHATRCDHPVDSRAQPLRARLALGMAGLGVLSAAEKGILRRDDDPRPPWFTRFDRLVRVGLPKPGDPDAR
ncbi:MAG: hypothetical protein MUF73_05140 [Rhodobacteraceae bacterium]|jgi:hypothetical protein|nr:hypothetical protein [Paracoccaceae bacterium]